MVLPSARFSRNAVSARSPAYPAGSARAAIRSIAFSACLEEMPDAGLFWTVTARMAPAPTKVLFALGVDR